MRVLNGSNTLSVAFGVTLANASRPSGSSSGSFSRAGFGNNETLCHSDSDDQGQANSGHAGGPA
jgi:hypothetical protein